MVNVKVLNLFLYNALKIYILWKCRGLIDAIMESAGSKFSIWESIPIFSPVLLYILGYEDSLQQFRGSVWAINPYLNAFLLLPIFYQNDFCHLILAVIVMFNCSVWICTTSFFILITYKLWWSKLCWALYVLLIVFGILMNGIHFILIAGNVKLRQVQTLQTT